MNRRLWSVVAVGMLVKPSHPMRVSGEMSGLREVPDLAMAIVPPEPKIDKPSPAKDASVRGPTV